ncbi:MAG: outer membrane beta-barrel protein [Chitinophagales bacterium]|nr:outer membrane beta-barrel protein [Chitinophagales bacterium]
MKKFLLQLTILFAPMMAFSQQNGWSPEQQEEFKQQMDEFKEQLQQEMDQLRDSLAVMNDKLKSQNWQLFDSLGINFNWPEIPSPPDLPSAPDVPFPPDLPGEPGDPSTDSTEVRIGRWKMIVDDQDDGDTKVNVFKDEEECEDEDENDDEMKNIRTRFALLDVGLNNYFGPSLTSNFPAAYDALEPIPGKSLGVNLHVINQQLNLIGYHLWLSYGAFFEFNSYKFNSDDVLIPKVDSIAFTTSENALSKNKLSAEYVGIPIMLRYESNTDLSKSFHIALGGYGEYLLGAHTKTKTTSGDKIKQHDDFNLNRFKYGVTGRIGYGWLSVFVNYSLSELFESGAGPVLTPASAGLAFEF